MAVMENWVAINRKNDALPPTPARTMLNFIRSFMAYMETLGLTNTLNSISDHVADLNNPHNVRINNLPDLVVDALWAYYQSKYVPIGKLLWSSKEAMVAAFDAFPPLLLEFMRQVILNDDFKYVDGAGPFMSGTPKYQLALTAPIPALTPFYSSTTQNPDMNYFINGNLTGLLGSEGLSGLTLFVSFRIQTSAAKTGIWVCYLGSDGSGTESIIMTYIAAAAQLSFTSSSTTHIVGDGGPLAFSFSSDRNANYVELKFALDVTPTGMTVYGYRDGVFTSSSVTWQTAALLTEFTAVTVSHDIWDCQTDETATKSVLVYNSIKNTDDIEMILSSL